MAKLSSKWLALAGVLAAGASSLFAQDSKALIDILIKKGILTPAEAQQIATEARHSENKSKTTISGKLFIDVSNISAKTAAGTTVDPSGTGADVKRFYLGVTQQFNDMWSANINTDSGYSSATGSTHVFIKTAYVQAKFSPAAILQVGSANMPWIPFDEDTYGFRYVENTLIDRLHAGNSADWGVHLLGSDGIVSYNVAAVNGGGYKNPTREKGMDLEGRLSVQPVKNLLFAVGGYTGKLGKDSNTTPATHTASRYDLLAAYVSPQGRLGVEYYKQTNWTQVTSAASDSGDGYSVFGAIKLTDPWVLFGRYDTDKPSKDLHPGMKEQYFNAGLQYTALKGVDVALVYKHDNVDNPASASQVTKYDEVGLFAQVAF